MNLLLTGATGFVGLHFLSFLSTELSEIRIFAPVRKTPSSHWPQVTWLPLDNNLENLYRDNEIDVVIHLLGKAHDTKNTSQADDYDRINFGYTKGLFDAFIMSNAKQFIFLSTIKSVGDDKTYVASSNDLSEPQTPYARSKRKAEQYISSAFLPSGKTYQILRPTLIYGPNVKGNLATLVKFAQKGLPYPFAAFQNKRSYLSINNLSFIFSLLLQKSYPSFIINIANTDAVSTQEIISLLARQLGKKAMLLSVPESAIRFAAKIGDVLKPFPFNSEQLSKITDSFVVDTVEMEKVLGVSLPEKTRETITQILPQ